MTQRTLLVLGARGRFGAAAAAAFADAGWRVLAQMRHAPAAPLALPRGVEPLHLPLADTAGLARRAAGADTVVYAVNPPYTRWDAEALPLLGRGLDLAQQLGATFMLPGNVYNFGTRMPALLQIDTPERPDTAKGRMRVAMEAEMQRRAAQGLDSVVIRAGDFYGAGTGNWFDQALVKDVARGRLVYPGPLDVPHAWAYLPDLALAFVAVAARAPRGHTRLHFEGHTLSGRELLAQIEAAARTLGLQPARGFRRAGMPWGLIRAVGAVVPLWRELARMSYLWRTPHALDGGALRGLVGALPATPIAEALSRSLAELGHGRPALHSQPTPA